MNSEFFTKNKTPIALLVGAIIIAGAIYLVGSQPKSGIDKSQLPAHLPLQAAEKKFIMFQAVNFTIEP